jgi:drug/metabolite transporter (DMT)-like permease
VRQRPSAAVLIAFFLVVLVGGTNQVAVRFSNRELAPFWGASLRFAVADVLLLAFAAATQLSLPRGGALIGTLAYGLVNFGAAYAFAYWGLLSAPAALASAFLATVPLLTLMTAAAIGLERFTARRAVGGVAALAGVLVMFADQITANVGPQAIVALLASAACVAAATVVLKRIPGSHPVMTNAIAMLPGIGLLLSLSILAGEHQTLPGRAETQLAVAFLGLGSLVLFTGFVFVVRHWTASATSYATVLFPVVTVGVGAALAGEFVSVTFIAGAALVMVGTYFGALSHPT